MLTAGADMAIVSKRLGYSTVTITTDLYSHPLGGVGRDTAEKAASPRAAPTARAGPTRRLSFPGGSQPRLELGSPDGVTGPGYAKAAGAIVSAPAARSGAGGTRTHGRRIMSLREYVSVAYRPVSPCAALYRKWLATRGGSCSRCSYPYRPVPARSALFRSVRASRGPAERAPSPAMTEPCIHVSGYPLGLL
ncbi:hypothetical protein [Streptomyces inusitatus]|uniref:hypothetical protein n=1 Tax=Streptomyces inusitatus TaxID=68221 RepID=UPI003570ABCC